MENLLKINPLRTDSRTKKIFVLMNIRFVPRAYINKNGECRMYLHITSVGNQKKIPLDFSVKKGEFDIKAQKIIGSEPRQKDLQLYIDNIKAKITHIETNYRLLGRVLTIDRMVEELKSEIPRGEFTAFMIYELEKNKGSIAPGTYRRYKSIVANLRKYKKEVYFSDMNEKFWRDYKSYFISNGRNLNTYYSNISGIKSYLKIAVKYGIKLPFDLDDLKYKKLKGNREDLSQKELKGLYDYFFSDFILEKERLPLGIFLFGCCTGLRISDLQKVTREQVSSGIISFVATKTQKSQRIRVNNSAQKLVAHLPELFKKRITEQHINRELKEIAKSRNIKKKLTIHVARHSFATNFLRQGGKVEQLQRLLGHNNIRETMIYVHVVEQEQDESVMVLDNLF